MGVKLGRPARPVVAIVGDGSAMMTVQALWTAAASNIPAVYLVCNNRSYRILKVNMNIHRREILGEEIPEDFAGYVGMDFPVAPEYRWHSRGHWGLWLHGQRPGRNRAGNKEGVWNRAGQRY